MNFTEATSKTSRYLRRVQTDQPETLLKYIEVALKSILVVSKTSRHLRRVQPDQPEIPLEYIEELKAGNFNPLTRMKF